MKATTTLVLCLLAYIVGVFHGTRMKSMTLFANSNRQHNDNGVFSIRTLIADDEGARGVLERDQNALKNKFSNQRLQHDQQLKQDQHRTFTLTEVEIKRIEEALKAGAEGAERQFVTKLRDVFERHKNDESHDAEGRRRQLLGASVGDGEVGHQRRLLRAGAEETDEAGKDTHDLGIDHHHNHGHDHIHASHPLSPHLFDDKAFIDVGAGAGLFTFMLCELVKDPRVWVVEPDSQLLSSLKSQSKDLNPNPTRLLFLEQALGSDNRFIPMFGPLQNMTGVSLRGCDGSVECKEKGNVEMMSFDDWYKRQALLEKVLLVKLDVGGYEPAVFSGMRWALKHHLVSIIIFNCGTLWNTPPSTDGAVLLQEVSELEKAGYHVFSLGAELALLSHWSWKGIWNDATPQTTCCAIASDWQFECELLRAINTQLPLPMCS